MDRKEKLGARWLREKAREQIGAPKPTRIRSHRKSGAARAPLDPDLNRPAAKMFHLSEARDYVEGAPRLATTEGILCHVPIVTLAKNKRGPKIATCFQYSQEVITHANRIRLAEGDEAMRLFLTHAKERNQPMPTNGTSSSNGHTAMAETLYHERETKPVTGSLEQALTDARSQAAYFSKEAERCLAEAGRWQQVGDSLQLAMQLTAQPLSQVKRAVHTNSNVRAIDTAPGEKVARGYWQDLIRGVLTEPMPKAKLYALLREHPDLKGDPKRTAAIYPGVTNMLTKGHLIEIDGNIAQASWTDPAAAARG